MNDIQESNEVPEVEPEDRYASPKKLLRIASWAYILSWVILALDAILFIGRLYLQFQDVSNIAVDIVFVFNWIYFLSALVGGIIWFVVLQAVSEGIYLWLDIDENPSKSRAG